MVFPRDFCVSSTSLPVAGASSALPGGAGEHHLQRQLGTGARARRFYRDQVLDRLNPAMVDFVGRQRLMFLATSGADGSCDSTLRAGPPGFLQVLDDRTVTVFGVEGWPACGTPPEALRFHRLDGASLAHRIAERLRARTIS